MFPLSAFLLLQNMQTRKIKLTVKSWKLPVFLVHLLLRHVQTWKTDSKQENHKVIKYRLYFLKSLLKISPLILLFLKMLYIKYK
jgi:hypothetical protein